MPTSRNVTPHGFLLFLLAISLLLLLVAPPPPAVDTGLVPVSVQSVPFGFEKTQSRMPAPWRDDVFKDGIPAGGPENEIPRRKARPSRTILRDERTGGALPLRSGAVAPRLVLIETLLDAFRIGLPPPAVAPGA